MPPLVHLIRHGETVWALTSRHTGRTDIPLTAHGEHESQQWATHLRSICFDHVLTSPLQRARRTCELCGLSKTAQIEPDLAEWDYGDYEGQRSVDICAARPGWNLFRDGCPNGESPRQVTARADRLIAHLRTLEGRIALFSHGQFGGVLAGRWIGLTVIEAQHFPLSTASLSLLSSDPHHPEVPIIQQWNTPPPGEPESAYPADANDPRRMKQRAIQRWENEGGEIPGIGPSASLKTSVVNGLGCGCFDCLTE